MARGGHGFYHFRDKDGAEVDVVMERGARDIVGVEVKAGATVTAADFRGLRKLKEAAGSRFVRLPLVRVLSEVPRSLPVDAHGDA